MSWYGNTLLPILMDALHLPGGSGEFRQPQSPKQLAGWLLEIGCKAEAEFVGKLSKEGMNELLDWLPRDS